LIRIIKEGKFMNREELLALREQVVASVKSLAIGANVPAEDKLPIILELARGDDSGLLKEAFKVAGEITEESAKLNAMLDVIAAIDSNLASKEETDVNSEEQSPNTAV
jgi:hypothetical protein